MDQNGELMRLTFTVVVLTATLVTGCQTTTGPKGAESVAVTDAGSMILDLPSPRPAGGQQSFSCRALMESDMTGSYNATLTTGLKGKVSPGANSVSIQIEGSKTLVFLSEAGFANGVARGRSFDILQNTPKQLAATFFDGNSVNTFVLNKSNGLAIWSKIRATFPVYDAPTGAQSYLICQ